LENASYGLPFKTLFVHCRKKYLPLDPRFASSNTAEDDDFLGAIKIRSTTSFGWKQTRWSHVVRVTAS
jgi:hypothetical protein